MKRKTYKRELAAGLLAFLIALAVYDLLNDGQTPALEWAKLLAVPFIGFAMAAFGLDAAFKQGGWSRPQPPTDEEPPADYR